MVEYYFSKVTGLYFENLLKQDSTTGTFPKTFRNVSIAIFIYLWTAGSEFTDTLIVSTFSWLSHLYERTRKRGWPVQNYHGVIITPWNYMFKTSWLTMHWSKKQCNSMWWWRMLHKDNDILSTLKTCWKICQTRPENFWTLSSSFWRIAMNPWLKINEFSCFLSSLPLPLNVTLFSKSPYLTI